MSSHPEAEQIVMPSSIPQEEEHVEFTHEKPEEHVDSEDDEWVFFEGSGYKSQLPNNPEWPVVERYVYPLPPTPQYAVVEQCQDHLRRTLEYRDAPRVCLVTGSNGIIGRRLVTMLIQRGAERVIALDKDAVTDEIRQEHLTVLGETAATTAIEYVQGSIDDIELITRVLQGVTTIFNAAVCVGPYHSAEAYYSTNHTALHKLIEGAHTQGVRTLVHVSTPLTRINPEDDDVVNKGVDELAPLLSFHSKNDYIRSRALGEQLIIDTNSSELATVVISPQQVYSAYDHVFLPSFLKLSDAGDLRILGSGENLMSITHVDNCCHALILASAKLNADAASISGRTYFVSDGGAQYFWGLIDDIVIRAGLPSLKTKIRAPAWLVSPVSYFMTLIDRQSKLNPSTVHMITKNRYLNIERTIEDLSYYPIRSFREAWLEVCGAILPRLGYPCYSTRFYFEGVQFDGIRAEIAKIEKAEREEIARIRREEAEARFEEKRRQEEEQQQQKQDEQAQDEDVVGAESIPVDADVVNEEEEQAQDQEVAADEVEEEEPVVETVDVEDAEDHHVDETPVVADQQEKDDDVVASEAVTE